MPASANYPNQSPAEPTGPRYSARVALSCQRAHAPGEVLHTLHGLRSDIEERLRRVLGARYDGHTAQSAATDKLIVTFILRAASHPDAITSAGVAAGALAELLAERAVALDLSAVALVIRAGDPSSTAPVHERASAFSHPRPHG